MDSLGLYDIYGYYHQPFWHTWMFKFGIASIVVIVLAGLLWYVFRSMQARKKIDLWKLWFSKLEALEAQKISDMRFYTAVADIIKEVALKKLDISKSLTDLELALLLKTHTSVVVQPLGEVMERAAVYKYDPLHAQEAQQKKELVLVREAVRSIQQMEQKQ